MKDLRNRVQLVGHLGMDPEVKSFDNGKKLAKFSLATSQSYTNAQGEKTQDTQWHNIVAWGKQAELIEQKLKKGHELAMEGKIIYRNYLDKDGQKRYITEIMFNDFVVFPGKGDE